VIEKIIEKKDIQKDKNKINDIFKTFSSNNNNTYNVPSSDLRQIRNARNQLLNQKTKKNQNEKNIESKRKMNPNKNLKSDNYYNSLKGKYSFVNSEKEIKHNKISENYKRSFINPNNDKSSFLNLLSSRNLGLKSSQQTKEVKTFSKKVFK